MKHGVASRQVSTQRVHVQCDGGMQSSNIKDSNSCTVRSFAIAYGIPYEEAFKIAEEAGRCKNEGWWMYKIMTQANKKGYSSVWIDGGATIYQFRHTHNEGRYICVRDGHAFALIDGRIYDVIRNPANCRITEAWRVESQRQRFLKGMV